MEITFSQLKISKKIGRSRLRRLDSALKDLKTLEVNTWWKKARGRNLWSKVIRETTIHRGCGAREEEEEEEEEEEGGGEEEVQVNAKFCNTNCLKCMDTLVCVLQQSVLQCYSVIDALYQMSETA